jgi:hypothetical protein
VPHFPEEDWSSKKENPEETTESISLTPVKTAMTADSDRLRGDSFQVKPPGAPEPKVFTEKERQNDSRGKRDYTSIFRRVGPISHSFLVKIKDAVYGWLDPISCIQRRNICGGAGSETVRKVLKRAKEELQS